MSNLPVDVIGLILSHLELDLIQLTKLQTVCRQFWIALNSRKLAHLWHGKYLNWYTQWIQTGAYRNGNKHHIRYETNHRSAALKHYLPMEIVHRSGVVNGPPRYIK